MWKKCQNRQNQDFFFSFILTGNFKYQFTQLGTFYVWSGYVDVYGIKNYAGQIEVVEKMSKVAEISVKVDGIESLYSVGGGLDLFNHTSGKHIRLMNTPLNPIFI